MNSRAVLRAATALVAAGALSGCNPSDKLLSAPDPDLVDPANVQNADGADALRVGTLNRLRTMTGGAPAQQESTWLLSGMLTDEYLSTDTFTERNDLDLRNVQDINGNVTIAYRNIHRTRVAAILAVQALKQFKPTATTDIAEMYMARGYAELMSGEQFCNGQPFSDASGADVVYGKPLSYNDAFSLALASLDSGLTTVGTTATDARSTTIRNSLRVLRGRVLLDLGRFTDAATAVGTDAAGVPTSTAYVTTYAQASGDNRIWELTISAGRYSVADRQGTNGLPFVSANDPRVPTCALASRATQCPTFAVATRPFDRSTTPYFYQLLWPTRESPVTVVSGVEARLVEAEARLRANDAAGMLGVLNALRANTALYRCAATGANTPSCQGTPTALAPLTDPGTDAGRQDLLFRERAFWLFGTGHRLGDLRRLIRQYNRNSEAVFPTGAYFNQVKGAAYGTDVNLPVPQAEQNNPNVGIGKGCTDRAA